MTRINQTANSFAKSIQGLGTSEALSRIEEKIRTETNNEMLSELLVMKAQCHAGLGERDKAIQLLIKLLQTSGDANVPYFLAELLAQSGEFEDAIINLTLTIDRSRERNENWFVSTALLLRSYCAVRTSRLDLAKQDIDNVEEDEEIFWLSNIPRITKQQVREMIIKK